MFRYRLFDVEGEGVGEIDLADPVRVGDHVNVGRGRRLRIVSLVFASNPESHFDGFALVEPSENVAYDL